MYHVPCELKWPAQINNFRAITSVYIKYSHQFIRYFNKIFILFNFLLFLSTTNYILSLSLSIYLSIYLSTHFFWLVALSLSLSLYPSLYVSFTPQTRPNLQTSTDLQQDPYSLLKQDPISTPSRSSTDQARLTSTDQTRPTSTDRSSQAPIYLSVGLSVWVCLCASNDSYMMWYLDVI